MSKKPTSVLAWKHLSDAREDAALDHAPFAALVPPAELDRFLAEAGALLGRPERQASFALYALGLLGEGQRKSAEPIAARAAGGDALLSQRYHDRLCHFLNSSRWGDAALRGFASRFALAGLSAYEPEAWILDDVCFPKQGAHSPGVERQHSRAAGRLLNCQVAVGLTLAARSDTMPIELPVGLDLYLPESWAADEKRRKRAKIPEGTRFRTTSEIAIDLLAEAAREGLPPAPVVAGAAYGADHAFRNGVARAGLHYVLEIEGDMPFVCPELGGEATLSAREFALSLPAPAYRRVTWLEGDVALSSRFARVRVAPSQGGPHEPREQDLLIEWPEGHNAPARYALSTLPAEETLEKVVGLLKARKRSRRPYEGLRRGLGLNHFEGRTYVGWQHHVSVVLACYALVVACQGRAASRAPSEPASAEAVESAA
jgi:SRSO17 transposase